MCGLSTPENLPSRLFHWGLRAGLLFALVDKQRPGLVKESRVQLGHERGSGGKSPAWPPARRAWTLCWGWELRARPPCPAAAWGAWTAGSPHPGAPVCSHPTSLTCGELGEGTDLGPSSSSRSTRPLQARNRGWQSFSVKDQIVHISEVNKPAGLCHNCSTLL